VSWPAKTGTKIKQEHFVRLFMSKVGLRPLLCTSCFANDPNRLLNGFLNLVFHGIQIIDTFFTRQNQLVKATPKEGSFSWLRHSSVNFQAQ
jgi:hypothetical protein